MESTRALLDELMGKDRNVPLSRKKAKELRFTDSNVCKYELAGLCPFTLFKNTKSDLGHCQYELHRDHLDWEKVSEQWDALTDREKLRYGYERELYHYLDGLVKEMDRKIARSKERAEKESAPRELKPEERVQLDGIQTKLKEALDKAEKSGEDGDIDQSMLYSQQGEALKKQYDELHKTFTQPERTMTVCEVCGVFINSTDNEQRRRDHLNGKQYMGWKSIRQERDRLGEKLEQMKKAQEQEENEESVLQPPLPASLPSPRPMIPSQPTSGHAHEETSNTRDRLQSSDDRSNERKSRRERSRSPRYSRHSELRRRTSSVNYEDSYKTRSRH